jgi:hypothetical protein
MPLSVLKKENPWRKQIQSFLRFVTDWLAYPAGGDLMFEFNLRSNPRIWKIFRS